jgi:hypothetical protein
MALDERARHERFVRLEEALGPESAETLMELLPPVGWADVATKHDLAGLEERMNLQFDAVDRRFEAVERRFEAVERRFDGLDQRFELSEHKLMAAFRAELLTQTNVIGGQMRTLVIANVSSVLSIAALAFGMAKLT